MRPVFSVATSLGAVRRCETDRLHIGQVLSRSSLQEQRTKVAADGVMKSRPMRTGQRDNK
jgi:hypothetical protein